MIREQWLPLDGAKAVAYIKDLNQRTTLLGFYGSFVQMFSFSLDLETAVLVFVEWTWSFFNL